MLEMAFLEIYQAKTSERAFFCACMPQRKVLKYSGLCATDRGNGMLSYPSEAFSAIALTLICLKNN